MADYVAAGNTLCGDAMGRVIAQALQMGESNACMKRIVAAPTAGSLRRPPGCTHSALP